MQINKRNKSFMHRIISLQVVIGSIIVATMLAMVVFLGFIANTSISNVLEHEKTERMKIASIAATRLDDLLTDSFHEIEAIARESAPFSAPTRIDISGIQSIFSSRLSERNYFGGIAFLDINGRILVVMPSERQAILEMANEKMPKKSLLNQSIDLNTTPVQDIDGRLHIVLIYPVSADDGIVTGRIMVLLDMASPPVDKIVNDFISGKTGYNSLVAPDGAILASSSGEKLYRKSHIVGFISYALKMGKTIIEETTDDNQPSGAEIVAISPLSVAPLVFTAEQDRGEFLTPMFNARRRFITAGVVVIIVGFAGSATAIKWLARPLQNLSQSANRMSAGDLSTKVKSNGIKEFYDLGFALEDMREKIQRRNSELSMMLRIGNTMAQDLPIEKVADIGLELILDIMEADSGGIHIIGRSNKLELISHRGISQQFADALRELDINEGIAGLVISKRQAVTIAISEFPTESLAPLLVNEGINRLISAPLITGDTIVGVVSVGRKTDKPFIDSDYNLLNSVASQLALSYEKARLALELKKRAERRVIMGHITETIALTLEIETIYKTLVTELPKLVEFDRLSVTLFENNRLKISYVSKDYSENLLKGAVIHPDNKMFYDVVRLGKPVIRRNIEIEAVQPMDKQLLEGGICSSVLIPVVAGERIFGSLNLGSREVNKYSEADLEYLQPVADQLAVAMSNARLFKLVEMVAEEWRNTFDAMNDGVAILSTDLRIQRVNKVQAQMVGNLPRDLIGKHCYEVFHNIDKPVDGCISQLCLFTKLPHEIIKQEPHLDDRWIYMRCDPIMDSHGQVVSIVHTMRDITREKQRQENLEKLYKLSQILSSTLDLDKVMDNALEQIISTTVGLFKITTAGIALIDKSQQNLSVAAVRSPYMSKIEEKSVRITDFPEDVRNKLFEEHRPYIITDAYEAPYVLRESAGFTEHRSVVIFPLLHGNRTIGALFIGSIESESIDEDSLAFVEACANQISMAIENARLFTQTDATLTRRVNELVTLIDVLTVATHGLKLDDILKDTLKRAAQALAVERTSVIIMDETRKIGSVLAVYQKGVDNPTGLGMDFEIDKYPVLKRTHREGQSVVIGDTQANQEGLMLTPENGKSLGVRSYLMVPLTARGQLIGSMQFGTVTGPRLYSSEEVALAKAIAGHFAYIIENAQLYERTEKERSVLEAIISSMGEGLVVIDANSRVVYCNQPAEDILDIKVHNVIGQPAGTFEVAWFNRVIDAEKLKSNLNKVMMHLIESLEIEFELLAKGSKHVIKMFAFPIKGVEFTLGTGFLLRDITLESEVDRMKTEFVSIASHELRTPMTIIYGFTELLLKSEGVPDKQRGWIDRIYKESQRLTNIIDDFLNISRIESGRLNLKLETIPLQPIITKLISQLSPNYQLNSFTMEITGDLPAVFADDEKLTQILYNIMDNAAKYSPKGGSVIILAKEDRDNNRVILAVSDRGVGIPEDEMPKLFTRFHRVHRPELDTIRGTGLGLSIVKSLVEMMGGEVWAESKINEGSTFYVALKAADTTQTRGI